MKGGVFVKNCFQQIMRNFKALMPKIINCAKKAARIIKKIFLKFLLLLERIFMYLYVRLFLLLIVTYALVVKLTELIKEIKSNK